MRTEVPVFKRCCFCLPVRHGLLLWGYLDLLINILALLVDIDQGIQYIRADFLGQLNVKIRFSLSFLITSMNFAFTFILIVGAHKKNSRLLKKFCYCIPLAVVANFIMLFTNLMFYLVHLWEKEFENYSRDVFLEALACIIYIGLQLYILAITRSEILKLESQQEFRFTNIAAEAECEYFVKQENAQTERQENTQIDKHQEVQLPTYSYIPQSTEPDYVRPLL